MSIRNYIIYMPDSLRAESLGCYGNKSVKTPNFDKLAAQGVRFENCYAQNPACTPSRCSMMTGWYPHNTGIRNCDFGLDPGQPSLFKYMKERGFNVVWFGKNDLYSEDYFPMAVSCSSDHKAIRKEYDNRRRNNVFVNEFEFGQPEYYGFLYRECTKSYQMMSSNPVERFVDDGPVVERSIEFLKTKKAKEDPFILFMPLIFPHPPYAIMDPYSTMYDPEAIQELRPPDLEGKPGFHKLARNYHGWDRMKEKHFKRMNSLYLGMISYSDYLFGKLMDTLEQAGLSEETAVFLLSDHGDYAGDYGMGHKECVGMEDPMLRVPLVIKAPGYVQNHVVREPVELFDIMPTIMEISNTECRHNHFARSLVPQMNGSPGDKERIVFSEGGMTRFDLHIKGKDYVPLISDDDIYSPYYNLFKMMHENPDYFGSSVMVRSVDHKLIYRIKGECELYDMKNDPNELKNLYNDSNYSKIKHGLKERLLSWYMETSDVMPYTYHSRRTREYCEDGFVGNRS